MSRITAAVALLCAIAGLASPQPYVLFQDKGGMAEGGKLKVPLLKFEHAAGCPAKCKTCQVTMARCLDWLDKNQNGGAWEVGNGGTTVITSIGGLALMANGNTPTSGPYSKNLVQAMQYVLRSVAQGSKSKGKTASGMEFEGFGNWDLGYAAIFLSEYYAMAPTPQLKEKLEFIAGKICEQREPNKGWGHAPNFAYKDLVVVSSACLAGLGSIKNIAGLSCVPDEAIDSSWKYLEASSAGGTVGYSPREGQKGWGHAGRASGCAWAMARAGVSNGYFQQVAKFCKQDLKNIPKDHASPTLHYLWGGLWAYMAGRENWNEYNATFHDWWLSAQQKDGSFKCPTEADVEAAMGFDSDGMIGPAYPTVVYALVWALPLEKSNLHRVKPAKKSTATKSGLGLGSKTGWLGLVVKPVDGGLAVTSVLKDGPAAKAGVPDAAVLVEINGKAVKDAKAAREMIKPQAKMTLTLLVAGERKSVEVTVGDKPSATVTADGEEI